MSDLRDRMNQLLEDTIIEGGGSLELVGELGKILPELRGNTLVTMVLSHAVTGWLDQGIDPRLIKGFLEACVDACAKING